MYNLILFESKRLLSQASALPSYCFNIPIEEYCNPISEKEQQTATYTEYPDATIIIGTSLERALNNPNPIFPKEVSVAFIIYIHYISHQHISWQLSRSIEKPLIPNNETKPPSAVYHYDGCTMLMWF